MLPTRLALAQRSLAARGRAPSRPMLTGPVSHIHSRIGRGASASSPRAQATDESFYDRESEKSCLDTQLKRGPGKILLILGPPNCGKTALLKDFCKGKRHVVYVDCREVDFSGPDAFIASLLEKLVPMAPCNLRPRLAGLTRELLSSATVSKQGLSLNLKTLAQTVGLGQPASTTLNQVFETLIEIFGVWKKEAAEPSYQPFFRPPKTTYGPVLIIDEANKLMSWADKHPERLRSLLEFFVKITKQDRQCHVLMATSEFGFQTWLDKAVGPGNWRAEVIGDFTESEARDFLFQQLGGVSSSDGKSIDKDDKAWAAVYEVCGGNAGALRSLADELRGKSVCDWENALKKLWQVELGRVRSLSEGGEGFTAVHYAAAALTLLDRQQAHNTVGLEDMKELLGRYVEGTASKQTAQVQAGAAVLKSLVKANALSVRPPSSWARDIPEKAFGDGESLVTAPSTVDLYCMRRIRRRLEKVLKEQGGAQSSNPLQGPSSAGPHGEVAGGEKE